jgi:hemerythrin-like domain-containing protein
MDGITLLKEDHKAVKRLFRQYEKTHQDASPQEKRDLTDKMIQELTTHSYIEEAIFYPAARLEIADTKDSVLESVEEHHVVAWLLSEIGKLDPADETFDAKVTVLIENVEHHIEEEEQELFPEVREKLSRHRLTELGERMAAAKVEAPADPLALTSASS